MQLGGKLGLDSPVDTSCAGRFAYVEEFIEDTTVTTSGFTNSLEKLGNLPLVPVAHAYDRPDGQTVLLEHNSVIYLGD